MARDEKERKLEHLHQESYGWALACCGHDPNEAEDVLQMTYEKILDGTAHFEGRSEFRTWLFGVIRRTAYQRRRRFAIQERLCRLLFVQQVTPAVPSPDSLLDNSIESKRLIRALHKLPARQREVLQLVFYHEMTIAEAASTLGISLGSARTHYHRAKGNLATRIREMAR